MSSMDYKKTVVQKAPSCYLPLNVGEEWLRDFAPVPTLGLLQLGEIKSPPLAPGGPSTSHAVVDGINIFGATTFKLKESVRRLTTWQHATVSFWYDAKQNLTHHHHLFFP